MLVHFFSLAYPQTLTPWNFVFQFTYQIPQLHLDCKITLFYHHSYTQEEITINALTPNLFHLFSKVPFFHLVMFWTLTSLTPFLFIEYLCTLKPFQYLSLTHYKSYMIYYGSIHGHLCLKYSMMCHPCTLYNVIQHRILTLVPPHSHPWVFSFIFSTMVIAMYPSPNIIMSCTYVDKFSMPS